MSQLLVPGRLIAGCRFWCKARDGDEFARALFHRHYSRYIYRDGRVPKKIIGPGKYILLISPDEDALFAWRKFHDKSGERGINCSIFRNEGPEVASEMIREADRIAWDRWPGERHYTYVNAKAIRSTNPGYCFIQAGWKRLKRRTKNRGLVILEINP